MSAGDKQNSFSQQFYPFLQGKEAGALDDVLASVKASTLQKCAEIVALRRLVLQREADNLVRCGEMLAQAFVGGAKLLSFGNGGSATDAQDVTADCILHELPALSLTNDIGVVTAVGNDVGFQNVYLRQLIA